jgi:hypothetical protein
MNAGRPYGPYGLRRAQCVGCSVGGGCLSVIVRVCVCESVPACLIELLHGGSAHIAERLGLTLNMLRASIHFILRPSGHGMAKCPPAAIPHTSSRCTAYRIIRPFGGLLVGANADGAVCAEGNKNLVCECPEIDKERAVFPAAMPHLRLRFCGVKSSP